MIYLVPPVTLKETKLVKIISQWYPSTHNLNPGFSLQKFHNRCDLHIMKALMNYFFFEKREFYSLNQQLMWKRAAKFPSKLQNMIPRVIQQNYRIEEQGIGRMMEYLKTWNDGMSFDAKCLFI